MKRTREYRSMRLAVDTSSLERLARAGYVTTARYEPAFRERIGAGILDLVFEREHEVLVLSSLLIDPVALAVRTGPAIVWPSEYADVLGNERADEIEDRLTPWLRTLERGRSMHDEQIRSYAPSAHFTRARERGLLGAAPLATAIPKLAPYVYARRFAVGKRVQLAGTNAALGAAYLRDVAASISLETPADPAGEAFERTWYGVTAAELAGPFDLAIVDLADRAHDAPFVIAQQQWPAGWHVVDVPTPVPLDLWCSFDAADAPVVAQFAVKAPAGVARPVRQSVPVASDGDSTGRIVLAMRDDFRNAPDSDTDLASGLAERLRREGFEATLLANPGEDVLRDADLVHVFGALGDDATVERCEAAQRAGVPFVVSLEPQAPWSEYQEGTYIAAQRARMDDVERDFYVDAMHSGRLQVDEIPHEPPVAHLAELDRRFATLARDAAGILLAPCDDPDAFAARFPAVDRARTIAGGLLFAPEPAQDPVDAQIPNRPFVLIDAPVRLRANIAPAVAALAASGIPVVAALGVLDVDLLLTLRRLVGSDTVILTDPSPGLRAALYRRAAAVLDPSLRPAGCSRTARAAACGALPIVASVSPLASWLGPNVLTFDPANPGSIVAAARAALESPHRDVLAARIALRCMRWLDTDMGFSQIISLYARAAKPVAAC